MIHRVAYLIAGIFFSLISAQALAGYSVDTTKIPSAIAADTQYGFYIRYTTPENVESLDILLSLKHPASGYTRLL